MRDPKRIKPFLAKLAELWNNNSDLRFNQLVSLINGGIRPESFYREDEAVLERIKKELEEQ